jgi:hypothetical protein
MKDLAEQEKEDEEKGMGAEAQDAHSHPDRVKNGRKKYLCQANRTTKQVCSDHSISSNSSASGREKMPAPTKCSSPKRALVGHSHFNSQSGDSTYSECAETLVDSPERPSQEQWTLPRHTRCPADSGGHSLISIPPCISEADTEALLKATTHPPVTKESLEELELPYIQSNITLRVDINYDDELHFTPVSGEKGEQKKRDGGRYWRAIVSEIKIVYQHSLLVRCAECDERQPSSSDKRVLKDRLPSFQRRLPVLFHKLRELLIILVPERDAYQISQYLDAPLLLQELSHGLLDIVRLADWLDVLLTSHCAPMRDVSAHEMAMKMAYGAEHGDVQCLVSGIEMLFQLLEAMKLDVANHQIRSFRFPLIEDTVTFQQDFFQFRKENGDFEVDELKKWYHNAAKNHERCQIDHPTQRSFPSGTLVHGMLEICLRPDTKLPTTFTYDHRRLKEIRLDIQDLLHLNMCLFVFDQLSQKLSSAHSKNFPSRHVSEKHVQDAQALLRNRIMDITDGNFDQVPQIWLEHVEAIAVELCRAAYHLRRGHGAQVPANIVAEATKFLTTFFEDEHLHQDRVRELQFAIEKEAHKHILNFRNMNTLEISHAQKHWLQDRAKRFHWRLLPEIEDIARRLAHVATIHWRVWADLVYLESDEKEHETGVKQDESISGEEFRATDCSNHYVQHPLGHRDTPVH